MPYSRRRAYVLFHDSCEVLDDLSEAFLSARAMARLAMDTLQEVGRVAAERTRRDSIRHLENTGAPTEEVSVDSGMLESQDVGQLQPLRVPGLLQPLEASVTQMAFPASSYYLEPDFFNGFEGDAGIFGNFDPSFDLGRIDAIFSANLDPSVPHFAEN